MKFKISEARKLAVEFIKRLGFSKKESKIIAENFIEAELTRKKTHSLGGLFWFRRAVKEEAAGAQINLKPEPIKIIKETPVSLHIDGRKKTGYLVLRYALDLALKKVKKSHLVVVGLANTEPETGYVGYYARKATEQDRIFICFHNSGGMVAPFGSRQRIFGSNAFTIGVPTHGLPVVLDMATAKITVGQLLKAIREKKKLPPGVAIDDEGKPTRDPNLVRLKGALVPLGEHKGSGLSLMCELLAGALTGSKVGRCIKGGWGTLFFLINPNVFRPIDEFKTDVETAIAELKNSKKRKGVKEIFYPGEQSQKLRLANLKKGTIEVDAVIINQLKSLISQCAMFT